MLARRLMSQISKGSSGKKVKITAPIKVKEPVVPTRSKSFNTLAGAANHRIPLKRQKTIVNDQLFDYFKNNEESEMLEDDD